MKCMHMIPRDGDHSEVWGVFSENSSDLIEPSFPLQRVYCAQETSEPMTLVQWATHSTNALWVKTN